MKTKNIQRVENDKMYFIGALGMDNVKAQAHAEKIEELRTRLHEGIVHFRYLKVDGTLREAYGTLNQTIYGEANTPKGDDPRKQNIGILPYFDTEKQAWRSLKKANLAEIL